MYRKRSNDFVELNFYPIIHISLQLQLTLKSPKIMSFQLAAIVISDCHLERLQEIIGLGDCWSIS